MATGCITCMTMVLLLLLRLTLKVVKVNVTLFVQSRLSPCPESEMDIKHLGDLTGATITASRNIILFICNRDLY